MLWCWWWCNEKFSILLIFFFVHLQVKGKNVWFTWTLNAHLIENLIVLLIISSWLLITWFIDACNYFQSNGQFSWDKQTTDLHKKSSLILEAQQKGYSILPPHTRMHLRERVKPCIFKCSYQRYLVQNFQVQFREIIKNKKKFQHANEFDAFNEPDDDYGVIVSSIIRNKVIV